MESPQPRRQRGLDPDGDYFIRNSLSVSKNGATGKIEPNESIISTAEEEENEQKIDYNFDVSHDTQEALDYAIAISLQQKLDEEVRQQQQQQLQVTNNKTSLRNIITTTDAKIVSKARYNTGGVVPESNNSNNNKYNNNNIITTTDAKIIKQSRGVVAPAPAPAMQPSVTSPSSSTLSPIPSIRTQQHKLVHASTVKKRSSNNKNSNSTTSNNNSNLYKDLSIPEKAIAFVQKVISNHEIMIDTFHKDEKIAYLTDEFTLLETDDIIFFVERFLHRQADFESNGKNIKVDIGYHFIQYNDINTFNNRLRKDGLICKNKDNAAIYGEGIYTSNNPFTPSPFHNNKRDKILLIARLKGTIDFNGTKLDKSISDSIKINSKRLDGICVLARTSQCIPILQIDSDTLIDMYDDDSIKNDMVHKYHRELQIIIDDFFNKGQKVKVIRAFPSQIIALQQESSISNNNNNNNTGNNNNINNTPVVIVPALAAQQQRFNNSTNIFSSSSPVLNRHRINNNHIPTTTASVPPQPVVVSNNSSNNRTAIIQGPSSTRSTPNTTKISHLMMASPNENIVLPKVHDTAVVNTIVYYTAPEYVNEESRIPTEEDVQNAFQVPTPNGDNCLLCHKSLRGLGVIGRIPFCQHEFHTKCLFKKLIRQPHNCPACKGSIGQLLTKGLMNIDPKSKIPTLIIDAKLDLRNRRALNKTGEHRKHCSSVENHLRIVPARQRGSSGSATGKEKFSFAYVCGSTFDFSRTSSQDGDDQASSASWSKVFNNLDFLRRIQARVKKHTEKCPLCRRTDTHHHHRNNGEQQIAIGVMPTGAMRVDLVPEMTCSGYEPGTLLISYRFEGGVQANYHIRPGDSHRSTYREAYLPNNIDGQKLLKRLIYAFSRGMSFKIGTSVTTGESNSVTWASIPHKTNLSHGTFGYPDSKYFIQANEELDLLGVPSADCL